MHPIRTTEAQPYAPWVLKTLTLDLAWPVDDQAPLCVLCIHGGGWDKGDKDALRPEIEHLARAGYAAASLNYRLSGTAVFPAPWEDVWHAIAYLRRTYPRIVLLGHSAGGHLAGLAGLAHPAAGVGAFAPVDGIIGLAGVYDMRHETARTLGFLRCLTDLLGGSYDDPAIRTLAERASPIAHIDAWRGKAAPPVLLLHGVADPGVPPAQTTAFAQALAAAGVPVESHLLPGVAHYLQYEAHAEVMARVVAFVERIARA